MKRIIFLMILSIAFSTLWVSSSYAISRDSCMSIAASYYYSTWTAVPGNGNSTYNYYTTGMITQGLPYNWGGYEMVTTTRNKLAAGAIAGDGKIFSSTHSDFAGNDCSGYVSRCWRSGRYSTASFYQVSSTISYTALYTGDATNYPSHHIRLFDYFSSGTNYLMNYETTTGVNPGRTAHRITARDNNYSAIRYNNITPYNQPNPVNDWLLYQ